MLLVSVLTLLVSGCSEARNALPAAVDLRADAQTARAQRLPIVLFFHLVSCPFCREAEDLQAAITRQFGVDPRAGGGKGGDEGGGDEEQQAHRARL